MSATSSTMELSPSSNPSTIYQFKITLRGPQVWRRVQIPGTYNFWDLHTVIQDSMGWEAYHLHKFQIDEMVIGPPTLSGIYDDEDEGFIPELTATISDYFKTAGDAAYYEYDFGIGWQHDVVLEKIVPGIDGIQYPQCIDGKKACPPEDRCEEEGYDPTKFDPKLVKFDNSEKRLKYDPCY